MGRMAGWLEPAAMAARMDLSGPAACGPDRDWAALIARREAWRAAIAGAGARRVALHFGGTFEFAAALLGTWAAGATAILPGDATEITIANLAPHADAFAGDFPDPARPRIAAPDPGKGGAGEETGLSRGVRPGAEPFPAVPLVLFTSGTTGAPTAVAKSAADVANELRSLEAAFGAIAEGACGPEGAARARVLSTVGHQHIYGLLFRCLWPLASRRPFADSTLRYPEELAEALAAPGPAMVVASPAFLKRLPGGPAWPNPPAAVFSSGGPLPWEAAAIAGRLFGSAPIEIYGSTETGGIAWRLRNAQDTPWSPFPGVAIALAGDGALWLEASPHAGGPFPFATADRAEWAPEAAGTGIRAGTAGPAGTAPAAGPGFRLSGRADRIVKLEEKRLSLTAMEDLLGAHPRVAEAKLIVLPGSRETLGAVLRLRDADLPLRGMPARDALLADLRAHLARGFERVLLPRRWRLVLEMPANAAGKPAQAALAALFEPLHGPLILRESAAEGALRLELDIHPELEAFRGHFPEAPLLPGVVQVDWAIREGERRFGALGSFRGLKSLKFQRPISPGMRVTLTLSRLPAKGGSVGGLAFAYDSPAGRHSAGQAAFA